MTSDMGLKNIIVIAITRHLMNMVTKDIQVSSHLTKGGILNYVISKGGQPNVYAHRLNGHFLFTNLGGG